MGVCADQIRIRQSCWPLRAAAGRFSRRCGLASDTTSRSLLLDGVDQVDVHGPDLRVDLERVEAEGLPGPLCLNPPWGISDTRGRWSLISTAPTRSAFATRWARCTSLVYTELYTP